MHQSDQELARVSFNVPRRLLPELGNALGDFAIANNVAIRIDEEAVELVPYDPMLTSTVLEYDEETGQPSGRQTRAITRDDLRAFAMSRGITSNLGSMTFDSVVAGLGYLEHEDCLVPVGEKSRYRDMPRAIRAAKSAVVAELLGNDLELQSTLTDNQRELLSGYFKELFALSSP